MRRPRDPHRAEKAGLMKAINAAQTVRQMKAREIELLEEQLAAIKAKELGIVVGSRYWLLKRAGTRKFQVEVRQFNLADHHRYLVVNYSYVNSRGRYANGWSCVLCQGESSDKGLNDELYPVENVKEATTQ